MMMVGDDDGEEEEEEEDDDEEGGGGLSWCQEEEVQGAWTALRALDWLPLVQATVTDVIKRCVCTRPFFFSLRKRLI